MPNLARTLAIPWRFDVRPAFRSLVRTPVCVALVVAAASCANRDGPLGPVPPVPPPPPVLTSVAVSLAPATIQVGQTATATVNGFDQIGAPFRVGAPVWSSSPVGVATVDANGLVSGVAPGQATVMAEVSGKRGARSVVVVPVPGPGTPVADLQVRPFSGNVTIGQTLQLVAIVRDAAGITLSGRPVTWTSSAPAVATVASDGLVSALSLGTVIIEAASEGQHGAAALTVIGAIDPGIVIAIAAPVKNQLIGDTLLVVAYVTSGVPLASVVASVGPQQLQLVYTQWGAGRIPPWAWVGRLNIFGLRFGPYTATVTATDSAGSRGQASVPFQRDATKAGGTGKGRGGSKLVLPIAPPSIPQAGSAGRSKRFRRIVHQGDVARFPRARARRHAAASQPDGEPARRDRRLPAHVARPAVPRGRERGEPVSSALSEARHRRVAPATPVHRHGGSTLVTPSGVRSPAPVRICPCRCHVQSRRCSPRACSRPSPLHRLRRRA